MRPSASDDFEQRDNNSFSVIARLKPAVSASTARSRLDVLVAQLRAEHRKDYVQNGITLVRQADAGVHPMFRSSEVELSAVVMVVVGILLLIGCVNVANLFLARARDRAREMAIRLSLGATRASLVRQLLTESLLISVVAGAVGIGVAWWGIGLGNQIWLPFDIDFNPDFRLSPMVLGFTLVTSALTGLLFGIAPARQATSPSVIPALKGETPAGAPRVAPCSHSWPCRCCCPG